MIPLSPIGQAIGAVAVSIFVVIAVSGLVLQIAKWKGEKTKWH